MSTMNTNYNPVQQISDIQIFQGDTNTLSYEFYYDNNEPINLRESGINVRWVLCYYGEYDYPILTKTMLISSAEPYNVASVQLTVSDIKNLDNVKCTYQPIVTYTSGGVTREYRRAEGNILFKPRIQYN